MSGFDLRGPCQEPLPALGEDHLPNFRISNPDEVPLRLFHPHFSTRLCDIVELTARKKGRCELDELVKEVP
jgi:hypothetical protein